MLRSWAQKLMLAAGLCVGATEPVSATIFQLEVGMNGLSTDRIEIARDEEFKQIIVASRVGQASHYLVNFEKSGVYVYRLIRGGQEIERDRIAVVLEGPPQDQMIFISWTEDKPGDSYRLSFSQPHGEKTWVISNVPYLYLRGNGVPWILRVRPEAASVDRKTVPKKSPINGLKLMYTQPPPAAVSKSPAVKEPPVLVLDPFASDEDQLTAEPDYKDLLKGPERKWWNIDGILEGGGSGDRGRTSLEPLFRRSRMSFGLRSFREDFRVNRRDRYESAPTQGLGTGFALHYYAQPTFQVQIETETHATTTTYDEGGTEPPAATQKRLRLLLGVLFDVLNLESRRQNWSLDVGTNIGLVQVPLRVDNQKLADIGFQASLRYFPWGLHSTVRAYKSESSEVSLQWVAPWDIGLGKIGAKKLDMNVEMGAYQRTTRAKDGTTTSQFHETGYRIGLELNY